MRTSKSFSTISYNTEEFLTIRLNDFVKNGVIEFWAFIEHKAEEDERKNHKHVFMIPSKQIDTSSIQAELKEIDMKNPLLPPLDCKMFKSSKFGDWYLYGLHDEKYLASKGQKRKYHYTRDDFRCSDIDYLNELIATIDWSKMGNPVDDIIDAAQKGVSFKQYIQENRLSLYQIGNAKKVYDLFASGNKEFYRGDRKTHSPKFDYETGEIIDGSENEL